MSSSALLDKLIEALQVMPGIGPVSAARIAYHLLDQKRAEGMTMADVLKDALSHISLCPVCHNYTDEEDQCCALCEDLRRQDKGIVCVVETPQDVEAIESSASFRGLYFVLHGHLSPLDGIGPEELGLDVLAKRLASGDIKEIILALSQSVEGDATAQYIAALAKNYGVLTSKVATGVPIGGDIRSTDGSTLATSIENRRAL